MKGNDSQADSQEIKPRFLSIAIKKAASCWHIGLIVFVAICGYFDTFTVPFVFDDTNNIVENEIIRNLGGFLTSQSAISTRAIGVLSFALNYKFHGLSVFGYHFTNLLIHITNGILVLRKNIP